VVQEQHEATADAHKFIAASMVNRREPGVVAQLARPALAGRGYTDPTVRRVRIRGLWRSGPVDGTVAHAPHMLVLTGEDDPICPLPVVEELASQLPAKTTRLVKLPGARHTIFRDRPDLAFPAVRDFVFQIKESQPAS
jgi:pimeloyl-ACP methyl ester carboxylesterase